MNMRELLLREALEAVLYTFYMSIIVVAVLVLGFCAQYYGGAGF
jgi:hypothetical protein